MESTGGNKPRSEEHGTSVRPSSLDSPASSNSSDSGTFLEEPFCSTLSYIKDHQQRLDDEPFSNHFRCTPQDQDEEEPIRHDSLGPQTGQAGVDLARRFLVETFQDEPKKPSNQKTQVNADLFGFLVSRSSNTDDQSNMWEEHSQRGIPVVDQSINLMDTENFGYSYNPATPSPKGHLEALKQPFAFLLPQNTKDIATMREVKPLVDIDLANYAYDFPEDYPGHSNSSYNIPNRKINTGRMNIASVLTFCLAVTVITVIALGSAPHHGQKLANFSPSEDGVDTVSLDIEEGGDTFIATIPESEVSATQVQNNSVTSNEATNSLVEETPEDNNSTVVATKQASTTAKSKDLDTLARASSSADEKGDQENHAKEKVANDGVELVDTSGVDQNGSRTDAIRYFIEHLGASDATKLQDPSSAVSRALQWISVDDDAQLVVPGFDTMHDSHSNPHFLEQLFQRYALAVLYFEMGGGSYDEKGHEKVREEEWEKRMQFELTWMQRHTVCEWSGVQCESGYVVALNLSHTLLKGTLPSEIFSGVALKRLSSLDMSYNEIHASLPNIPASSRRLLQSGKPNTHPLKHLQISRNNIQLGLENLVVLTSLTYVDVSKNRLKHTIPGDLAVLSELKYLSLYQNSLNGEIPSSLGSLGQLTTLLLDDNKLEGKVPASLGNLEQLENLRLLQNHLTGSMPNEICELRKEANLAFLMADCGNGNIICDCCTQCWRQ